MVEAEDGVGYERPLLSFPTRVATSIDGGFKGGGGNGNGCCRSCTSDMAKPEGALAGGTTKDDIELGSAFWVHPCGHEARRQGGPRVKTGIEN